MAGALVAADIILDARRRADMEGSEFTGSTGTPSEEETLLERAWQRLYARVVALREEFFLIPVTLSTTAGVPHLFWRNIFWGSIPPFAAFRGVRHAEGPFLRRLDPKEGPFVSLPNRQAKPTHYMNHATLLGDVSELGARLTLFPTPDAVYSMVVYAVPYIKSFDAFLASSHSYQIDWIYPARDYLVSEMAIMMKDKEESDVTVLLEERETFWSYISQTLAPMDAGEPAGVVVHGSGRFPFPTSDPYEEDYFD